jgi:hypothetical protein
MRPGVTGFPAPYRGASSDARGYGFANARDACKAKVCGEVAQ